VAREQLPRRSAKLMQRCVDTFQFATLASLTSRRLAAAAFGQAGLVHEILAQIATIANVQEARRESGLSSGKGDPYFLRQVKRPTANPDVDFQVYTLQEAVRAMPVRAIGREERIVLADQLALLAIKSDGWTAASAAASLIELGAIKYAIDVVDHIPVHDPTRSEGVLSLVRALLAFGDTALAEEQAEKAVAWVKSLDKRNPERATIWGLAEIYLERGMPDMALRLLEHRQAPPGLSDRVRRVFRGALWAQPSDDEVRDNRLRFQALLQQGEGWSREAQALYDQLRQWAPRLLDGEVLMGVYLDGLLRPLLAAGRARHEWHRVWKLLPQVCEALSASSGDKHSMQVQRVATLLAGEAAAALPPLDAPALELPADGAAGNGETSNGFAPPVDPVQTHAALHRFLVDLWQADAKRGLWQAIHGIEGSLPLVLALEGPEALVVVAQAVAREGSEWAQ
jgi:hypothetical protein